MRFTTPVGKRKIDNSVDKWEAARRRREMKDMADEGKKVEDIDVIVETETHKLLSV